LIRQGREQEALAAFLRVIATRNDEAPESHLEAALLYQQQLKDPIAAIYHFRKYLELQPNSRQAVLVRQRIDAAKRDFARTLPAHPLEDASVKLEFMDQLERLQRENDDLKAETSVNKELGIEFQQDGWVAGLTYFRNDYKNKIESGLSPIGRATGGTGSYANAAVYQWENVPKAVVQGIEGTLNFPISESVAMRNNFTYNSPSAYSFKSSC
jgi:tetratricopeptide (TPR) repeat protein